VPRPCEGASADAAGDVVVLRHVKWMHECLAVGVVCSCHIYLCTFCAISNVLPVFFAHIFHHSHRNVKVSCDNVQNSYLLPLVMRYDNSI
jgi:hypothetical protein